MINKFVNSEKEDYKVLTYILMFFTFGILGWIWEGTLQFLEKGILVNRGVLNGPWLPIYGWGGLIAIIILRNFKKKPILLFFISMLGASIIEYGTGWYLETTKGIRWWDYSNILFNLNGYICLPISIAFGLLGCVIVYYVGPCLNKIYNKIPKVIAIIASVILISLFIIDSIYSHYSPNMGRGITDYNTVNVIKTKK